MKFSNTVRIILAGLLCELALLPSALVAQASTRPAADPNLTALQIVVEMQGHNQARAAALKHYHSVRHYAVEYRGFSAKVAAQMEVDAVYDFASGKSFRIVSQSGSKMLIDK